MKNIDYKEIPELQEMMFLITKEESIIKEPRYALAKANFSPIADTLAKVKDCYGKLGYCTLDMLLNFFNDIPDSMRVHSCGYMGFRVRISGHLLTGTCSSTWYCPHCKTISTERGSNFKELREQFFSSCYMCKKEIPEGCNVLSVEEVIHELKEKEKEENNDTNR